MAAIKYRRNYHIQFYSAGQPIPGCDSSNDEGKGVYLIFIDLDGDMNYSSTSDEFYSCRYVDGRVELSPGDICYNTQSITDVTYGFTPDGSSWVTDNDVNVRQKVIIKNWWRESNEGVEEMRCVYLQPSGTVSIFTDDQVLTTDCQYQDCIQQ
jgi:hypothetical protein